MSHTYTNRPHMGATYAPDTVRARRWHGDGDVRGYRLPRGWTARAEFIPSQAAPCRVPCGGLSRRRNNPISTAPRSERPGRGGDAKSGRGGGRARCSSKKFHRLPLKSAHLPSYRADVSHGQYRSCG